MEIQIKETDITAPPEHCFNAFVHEFGAWWPAAYTFARDNLKTIGLEARKGGDCYEINQQNERLVWGTVENFDLGRELAFRWQIGPERNLIADPRQASLVHLRFVPALTPGHTDLHFLHTDFERHGQGAAQYSASLGSEQGWPWLLQRFRAYATGQPLPELG